MLLKKRPLSRSVKLTQENSGGFHATAWGHLTVVRSDAPLQVNNIVAVKDF